MSWDWVTFADAPLQIIDGDRGKQYPKQNDFLSEGPCLFLNTGNVTTNGFAFADTMFVSEQKDAALRKGKLIRDDIVMTTRGTIGNCAYYHAQVPYESVRINSGMVIFRAQPERLMPAFLYHYLRSDVFRSKTQAIRSGAAQPQLPIRDIKTIDLPLPPLPNQKRIALILSAYDNLIENNRRRIALLEEAARQLYKEWFVRFRFPGHEHVKIIDGVPEGWARKALRDVAILNYGKALKEEARIPGGVPVYGSSGIVGSHDKALVNGPGIILGRKGNVGSVRWSHCNFFPIDTVYFIASDQSDFHLYLTLQHMQFMSTDVAVPGLNREFAYSRSLIRPLATIGARFEEEVTPVFLQIQKLTEWNEKLAKARDLLLPKLMSGAIAV